MADLRDELVERIRVATFEAPKAGSHSEWSRRIKAMFYECCAECGVIEVDHGDHGDFHESGDPAYQPLVIYRSE